MARNKLVDTRDSRFVLFELLGIESLLKFAPYKDFDRETFEATLDLAETLAVDQFYDANAKGDEVGAVYVAESKEAKVPASYHAAWQAYVEAGFPALVAPPEFGGMGMPEVVWKACLEYLMAGCIPLCMYSTLPIGAYQLILRYGTDEQKSLYLAKMISGEWGGTMCLTEPVAGSDVGALKTKAVKQADGTYRITGSKIFITGGDHDLCSNIIHPVLARIEGDPDGTKGISIFLVPKYLVNPDGSLGARNDMNCSGIEHKMGIKGSATCSLNFGDNGGCVAYLLGEARQGMAIMFEMMNSARLEVALQGEATASAAYMHAAAYARERLQGYDPLNRAGGSVTIDRHPDVRRMLLGMKSQVEAMRAFTMLVAMYYDLTEVLEGEPRQQAQDFLDFVIPIAKAGNTDTVWDVTAEAIQVFGGYGFCSEYRVEQYARDCKIYSIYEGTNGIQSLDLLMRKLLKDPDQKKFAAFKAKVYETLEAYAAVVPAALRQSFDQRFALVEQAVTKLAKDIQGPAAATVLGKAVPLQKAFRVLAYAWVHLWSMGLTIPKAEELLGSGVAASSANPQWAQKLADSDEAAYYHGRLRSARYFLECELPKCDAFVAHVMADNHDVAELLPAELSGVVG